MKTINVTYYALLRQEAGLSEETVTSEATTVNDLYNELKARYSFKLSQSQVKVSINSQISSWASPLNDGDTVLFIPPVVGG